MDNPKENPQYADLLVGDAKLGGDDAAVLPARLDRYSKAHHRAVEMGHYASEQGDVKLSSNLQQCGSYLLFRDYYTVDKVRLHAAKFCHKHLLCPLCAIRRGAKLVQAYMQRLQVIKAENPHLKAYLVTLTVKDGEDLKERFTHLYRSVQRLHKMRTGKGQYSEASKAAGAVWSYEFKRGKNSGLWHPHMHAIWLCEEKPSAKALSEQWKKITGDSFIVDITPFHDQEDVITGFLEVFKYAVKFSDLPLEDNWHGFKTLAGKRLVASFGCFRGVDVPVDLTDEGLDDLPYVELLYKFIYGAGYTHIIKNDLPPSKFDKKSQKLPQVQPPEKHTRKSAHLRYLQQKYDK